MVGKRSLKSAEIRTYIKACNALKIESKTVHNEICKIFGDNEVSYRLVRNWIRKFDSGINSVQDASRSGRPRSAVTPKNMSKVNKILDSDARYTSYGISRMTGISEASTRTILKKLGLTGKVARWIPHILTNKQKAACVKIRASMFTKFCNCLHEIQKSKRFRVHAIIVLIFFHYQDW